MNFTSKIERRSTCRPRDCIFIYLTMCGCIGRSSPTVRSPWHIPNLLWLCCTLQQKPAPTTSTHATKPLPLSFFFILTLTLTHSFYSLSFANLILLPRTGSSSSTRLQPSLQQHHSSPFRFDPHSQSCSTWTPWAYAYRPRSEKRELIVNVSIKLSKRTANV